MTGAKPTRADSGAPKALSSRRRGMQRANRPHPALLLILSLMLAALGNGCSGLTKASASNTAPTTGHLTPNSTTFNFGNVNVGSIATQNLTLTNTGSVNVTVTSVSVSNSSFTVSLTVPQTVAPGQAATVALGFAPKSSGSSSASVSVVSSASNSPITFALSGLGVQPALSWAPLSVSFGNVAVGTTNTQTVTLSNTGTATLTISQATATGTGFGLNVVTLPLSISPGNISTLTVSFAPAATGSVTGTLTIASNAPNSPAQIPLSGSGFSATLALSANPTSLSFSNVAVGQSSTQSVTLTNTGNSPVIISQVQVSPIGAGFSASGVSAGTTLTPSQTATLNVTFTPTVAGSATGSVSVASNAPGSPLSIALSGSSFQPLPHSVTLNWVGSTTTTVVGYHAYRSAVSGGPYSVLTSSPVPGPSYTDSSVQSGQIYYYVVTAVDNSNVESVFSNQVQAVIPIP